jgi:ribosome-interacting GTPase 1
MPTNLPAEARNKWNDAATTKDPKKKVQLLQEFMSLVPKHKGTEKLRAQVKTKMSILRREMEKEKRRKPSSRGSRFFVEKEGAAQIVVLGQTKVGRSSILRSVTNAKVEVSDYPFTTREPVPGMLFFEDLHLQIVEAPALFDNGARGKAWKQQTIALARNADALVLMVDLGRNPCKQLSVIVDELENARILIEKPTARVEIEREHMGFGLRILVVGKLVDCTLKDVEVLLRSYGISNAFVRISGSATLDDVEDSIFESVVFRPTLVVANKIDVRGARVELEKLEKFVNRRFRIIPVSSKTGWGLEKLGGELFDLLEIIRVYTKEPGRKKPSLAPFILKKGATVEKLARQIHSDFLVRFSYAKIWSGRLPFSPQKVGLSFMLGDKDIVEIHAR